MNKTTWLVLGAVAAVVIIGLASYSIGLQVAKTRISAVAGPVKLAPVVTNTPMDTAITAVTTPPPEPTPKEKYPPFSATEIISGGKIVWHEPRPIDSLKLFAVAQPVDGYYGSIESSVTYYEVGDITYQGQSGKLAFILAYADGLGPAGYYLVAKYSTGKVLLKNYSDELAEAAGEIGPEGLIRSAVTLDSALVIPSLTFPEKIYGPQPRQTLTFVQRYHWQWIPNDLIKLFDDKQVGTVYTATSTNGFYLKSAGPLGGVYRFKADFFDADELVPQIIFNDGTKNKSEYVYTNLSGCGSRDYAAVVSTEINRAIDLRSVGKNVHGDVIYELRDNNSLRLKELYEHAYVPDGQLSYEQFLQMRPLLYWVDPFDRLIELKSSKLQPAAECGKPVIYLYPTKTTPVSVKLAPQGGFTYSEPAYQGGWSVIAEPNGRLTEVKSGQHYPYLFWEGRGGLYQTPDKGWVVRQAEVANFLSAKLSALGLNSAEIADFKDFWLPRMQTKPYYFITFMGNRTMDLLAPLTITPPPETVIRVLMDFTPLDEPRAAAGFKIRTPERKGFTVVEWGGVLR
ncbi:MAG: hypothetical protein Q7K39_01690 [Candidatus Magasanikbacteria bacterium]|nr:hypothetical protein [Candidatus Magasanikbacteria bacterium]